MKNGFWLFVLLFTLAVTSCEKDYEQLIYFNSFESQSDTAGWKGGAFDFANDAPENGGGRSLHISGGCIIPHAQYIFNAQDADCHLILSLWGKNLSNGGYVSLYVNKKGGERISIDVNEKRWAFYESPKALFWPANTTLTLDIVSGGFCGSDILIDMIEIKRVKIYH